MFLEMMNLSFINSIIGLLPHEFNINGKEIPDIYMAFSLAACLAIPCTKILRSKFSLKKIYNFSIFVIGISFLSAFTTHNWYFFCAARAAQGFFITAIYSISFVNAISESRNKENTINFISGLAVAGLILGPLLSGVLSVINWRLIYVIAITILIIIYFIHLKLPADNKIDTDFEFSYYEYLLFVGILFGISFAVDASNINSHYYFIDFLFTMTMLVIFSMHYIKSENTKLFNKAIFNKNLLYSSLVNFFVRFALIGTAPLASLVLHQNYSVTIPEISIYLAIGAIASLAGKFIFKIIIVRKNHAVNYIFFAITLVSLPVAIKFLNPHTGLTLFFSIFGLFSSLIFNYINSSFYLHQPLNLSSEATAISNIFQLFFYGICVNALFFSWFNIQALIKNTFYSLIIIMTGLSLLSLASLYFYQRLIKNESRNLGCGKRRRCLVLRSLFKR